MNWHLLPLIEISQLLNTSPSDIDSISAAQRLEAYGKIRSQTKKEYCFHMLLHQLTDFMILILIAAAIISGVLGISINIRPPNDEIKINPKTV